MLPDYCNPRDLFFASHSVHSINHPTLSRDMPYTHCLNSFHAICPSTYFIPPYALRWDKDCSLVIFLFPMVPRGTLEFRFFFWKEDVDVRSSGLNYQHKIINCVRERWLKYTALGKHLQVTKETQTRRPPGGTSQRRGIKRWFVSVTFKVSSTRTLHLEDDSTRLLFSLCIFPTWFAYCPSNSLSSLGCGNQ